MTVPLLLLALLTAAGGVLFGLYHWRRARRQADRLDRMLSQAIDNSFLEESFDESIPSALAARLARFLNGSAASARGGRAPPAALTSPTRPGPPSPTCCCMALCWRKVPSPPPNRSSSAPCGARRRSWRS